MSIDGAKQIVESVSAMLLTMDPGYESQYIDNETRALKALDALKAEMRDIAGDTEGQRVILMNEALVYAARDYGLSVAGQFDRESGAALYDAELSECLETLAGFDARVVLIEKQVPLSLVQALEQAGYAVARIDILSTHRGDEGFDGYIGAQKNNARAIRRALDGEAGA